MVQRAPIEVPGSVPKHGQRDEVAVEVGKEGRPEGILVDRETWDHP